jgi:hypothetical protein
LIDQRTLSRTPRLDSDVLSISSIFSDTPILTDCKRVDWYSSSDKVEAGATVRDIAQKSDLSCNVM